MTREKKNQIISIALSCIVLLSIAGYALMNGQFKKATGVPMTPTVLSTDISGGIVYSSNDGNNAVFCKTDANGYRRVTKYNIPNATETYISSTSGYPLFDMVDYQWISDNYVVWFDYRYASNPETEASNCDVYYSSLSDPSETRLTASNVKRDALIISGSYAAYIEYGTNPGIYIANLSAQNPTPSRIYTFTGGNFTTMHMDTYNNTTYLVYTDTNNNTSDIKLYNCNTASTITIANSNNIEFLPTTQNGYVFYTLLNTQRVSQEDPRIKRMQSTGAVYSYNIANSQSTSISSFNSDTFISVVPNTSSANRVILKKWQIVSGDKVMSLQAYTIGGSTTTIATGSSTYMIIICSNSCYGNYVVYSANDYTQYDTPSLYLYNSSTNTTTALDADANEKFLPKNSNGKAFYIKSDSNDSGIFKVYSIDID